MSIRQRHADPDFLYGIRENRPWAITRARQETRQKLRSSYRADLESAMWEAGRSFDKPDGSGGLVRVNEGQVRRRAENCPKVA